MEIMVRCSRDATKRHKVSLLQNHPQQQLSTLNSTFQLTIQDVSKNEDNFFLKTVTSKPF